MPRLEDREFCARRRERHVDLAVGIDALMLVHAVLLGGRSVVDAARGLPNAKAVYWRTASHRQVPFGGNGITAASA